MPKRTTLTRRCLVISFSLISHPCNLFICARQVRSHNVDYSLYADRIAHFVGIPFSIRSCLSGAGFLQKSHSYELWLSLPGIRGTIPRIGTSINASQIECKAKNLAREWFFYRRCICLCKYKYFMEESDRDGTTRQSLTSSELPEEWISFASEIAY